MRDADNFLEDIFESFLGALYLDQGVDFAFSFTRKLLYTRIKEAKVEVEMNPKSTLQEAIQGDGRGDLVYSVLKEWGEPNHKHFIIGVFLAVQLRWDLRFLGAFITGLVLVLLGVATVNYYVDVVPLPPALQSYWLVIHVLVAILGTAFFALGFALSVTQLLQSRRETSGESAPSVLRFLRTLPSSLTLENLAYRVTIIGFILWTFTLIAGSIWAYYAWSRFWGFDVKETWTFVIWVLYAGYIHARATRGWRGNPSAWLAIVGFSAVIFNFTIVNVFFKGLHAYSGLS
jgi:cytochrome c-type biogenesis protein CcsB